MNSTQKQKLLNRLMVLTVMAFFLPAAAEAFQRPCGGSGPGFQGRHGRMFPFGIWNNTKLCQELGLTDSQIEGLKNADFTFREKQLQLHSQLDTLKLQMDKSFSAATVDEAAVRKTAQAISEIKGKLYMLKIDSRLELRKLLNAEQLQKLETLKRERMADAPMAGHRQGHSAGRACPMKP